MVKAFEQSSNTHVAYQVAPRRAGDIAACWADTLLAEQTLGWKAKKDIQTMCDDAWRWQCQATQRKNEP